MAVSPLHIIIALEYAVSGEPGTNVPSNIWGSPAARDVKQRLIDDEMIQDGEPTERLMAWVEFICETPLPVKTWVRPDSTSNGG
jgi:hypothetical protein